jgi:hypothetical protein
MWSKGFLKIKIKNFILFFPTLGFCVSGEHPKRDVALNDN